MKTITDATGDSVVTPLFMGRYSAVVEANRLKTGMRSRVTTTLLDSNLKKNEVR
jgi:hypothetical protein